MPLTNHSESSGLYHVRNLQGRANEQLTGLYPRPAFNQAIAFFPAKNHDHTHLLTNLGRQTWLSRRWAKLSSHIWSEENGQDDLVWVSRKEDFNLDISNCAVRLKNTKGSGLFHLHVYWKKPGTTKGLFPTGFSVERQSQKAHSTSRHPEIYLPHWWVHLGQLALGP